jgi:cysteine sulfinate desulfinase/cysteine desulfurase-like protein
VPSQAGVCEESDFVATAKPKSAPAGKKNLAILGLTRAHPGSRTFVTSVVEHPATSGPVGALEAEGWKVERLPVDRNGLTSLPSTLPSACFVSVMHSNNETGVLQPDRVNEARNHGGGPEASGA